jgi:hypothetical protein
MIHGKLAISISAWESKQPSVAQQKHQVRRKAQEAQEGRAGSRDLVPEGRTTFERRGQRPSAHQIQI